MQYHENQHVKSSRIKQLKLIICNNPTHEDEFKNETHWRNHMGSGLKV
jgi:hypothetical protein